MARTDTRKRVAAQREKTALRDIEDAKVAEAGTPRWMARLLKRFKVQIGIHLSAVEVAEVVGTVTRQNFRIQLLEGLIDEYQRILAEGDEDEDAEVEGQEALPLKHPVTGDDLTGGDIAMSAHAPE